MLEKEQLKELYEKHQSLSLVAKELGKTKEGIRMAMRRYGLEINKPIRYSFDKRFFKKNTESVFYWAGFVAADGCLMKKKNSNSNILGIALASKDRDHLVLFKKAINSNHPIHKHIVKNSKQNTKWNDSEKVEIKLSSNYLPQDLARFNIVPRKTHIYEFPKWLVNHPLVNHFMRGYFDGDGSWFVGASKKTPQMFFSLRGTVDFLKIYRSILEQNGLPVRDKDPRINNGIGVLEYGGNGHTCKIRDFLYRDATVFMERKYELVKDIKVVERLNLTKEDLQGLLDRFGQQKLVAEYLGTSRPNVCRLVKELL